MPTNYTTVDHVNFRSSAGFEDNVIGSLHLAQNIQITGPQDGDRWMPAQADIDGMAKTGFISKMYSETLYLHRKKLSCRKVLSNGFAFIVEQEWNTMSLMFSMSGNTGSLLE